MGDNDMKKESYFSIEDIDVIKEWVDTDKSNKLSSKDVIKEVKEIIDMTLIDPIILQEPYTI